MKKFASINVDEVKSEKKPLKRPMSPKNKTLYLKNPIAVSSPKTYSNSINVAAYSKKIRVNIIVFVKTNYFSLIKFNFQVATIKKIAYWDFHLHNYVHD